MKIKIIIGIVAAVAVIPVALMLGDKAPLIPGSPPTAESLSAAESKTENQEKVERISRTDSAVQAEGQSAEEQPAAELQTQAAGNPPAVAGSLIDTFTLVAPGDSANCATRNPWGQGVKALTDQDNLSSRDCFALRVAVLEDVEIFLFSHAENGKLIRLFSSSCNAMGPVNSRVHSGEEIQLPQDSGGNHLVIGLDEQTGKEWFYAVAVKDESSKGALNSIISAVPDVCQDGVVHTVPVKDFQAGLDKLQQQSAGGLHWMAHSFLHI
ncbi:MAG TPA: hypothetical protein VIM41_11285 [Gammaproteobacteria bacterium]